MAKVLHAVPSSRKPRLDLSSATGDSANQRATIHARWILGLCQDVLQTLRQSIPLERPHSAHIPSHSPTNVISRDPPA